MPFVICNVALYPPPPLTNTIQRNFMEAWRRLFWSSDKNSSKFNSLGGIEFPFSVIQGGINLHEKGLYWKLFFLPLFGNIMHKQNSAKVSTPFSCLWVQKGSPRTISNSTQGKSPKGTVALEWWVSYRSFWSRLHLKALDNSVHYEQQQIIIFQ